MPAIYLQTSDGTRIAVPEEAGELSVVVRLALEIWAENHCPQAALTEDDFDNMCTNSGSDSERTPDHIMDDDEDEDEEEEEYDYPSTRNCSHGASGNLDNVTAEYKESREYDGGRLREPFIEASCDLDRTVSVLEDDDVNGNDDRSSSRTPSTCPSIDSAQSPPLRGQRKTPRRRGGSKLNSCDGNNAIGSLGFSENGKEMREFILAAPAIAADRDDREDSATPSTLEDEEVEKTPNKVINEQQRCVSLDAPPIPDSNPPSAHAHPISPNTSAAVAPPPPSSPPEEKAATLGSACGTDRDSRAGCLEPASRNNDKRVVVNRRDSSTVYIEPPPAAGEEEHDGIGERTASTDFISPIPTLFSPRSLTNEEFLSPSGYHHRTPCMIGDEEEKLLLPDGPFSRLIEEMTMSNKSKDSVSPGSGGSNKNNNNSIGTPGSVEPSPRNSPPTHRLTENSTNNTRPRSIVQNSSVASSNHTAAAGTGGGPSTEGFSAGHLQCFIISEEEIVIEVHKSLLLATTTTTQINEKEIQDSSVKLTPASQNHMARRQSRSACSATTTPVSTMEQPTSARSQAEPVKLVPAPAAVSPDSLGNNSADVSSPILSEALGFCVAYLRYFASDAEPMERLRPTLIPEPLSAPLLRFLSPWERGFLYREILGQTEEELATALEILRIAPTISYIYAAPLLSQPAIRAALTVKVPASDRVNLLAGVIRAAGMLKISSLENMCLAWCADFIIRASYASMDCFGAAALVRECFSVRNDWTRKEVDCLKLENEWPGNEEE
ncbi:hypothetical protein TcYC6_0040200 [Trypanosoma cruzi]|nr:hypothetical protein TcYC6_0040200 [Trypanosoma cruzi]